MPSVQRSESGNAVARAAFVVIVVRIGFRLKRQLAIYTSLMRSFECVDHVFYHSFACWEWCGEDMLAIGKRQLSERKGERIMVFGLVCHIATQPKEVVARTKCRLGGYV